MIPLSPASLMPMIFLTLHFKLASLMRTIKHQLHHISLAQHFAMLFSF
jgi:hypothetical protein